MSSSNLIRWGGLAAIVVGVMYVVQGIISLFAPQRLVLTSFSDYLIEITFIVALLGTLAAIGGLDTLQRERYGRLGAAGSLVAFVGFALQLASAIATALAGRQALGSFFLVGLLAALVGLVLLGATSLRARVLPRWCGVLLIVGFPVAVLFGNNGGGILLGIVWVLVGYALLSSGGVSARQPTQEVS